jgi:hypothetical protein
MDPNSNDGWEPVPQQSQAPSATAQSPTQDSNDGWEPVPQQAPTPHSDEIQVAPQGVGSFKGNAKNAAKAAGALFEGAGEGAFSTIAGITDIGDKIGHAINPNNPEHSQASKTLHHLAGDDNTQRGGVQSVGYGGETLMEFLMGDEAIKALPLAKRLSVAAKTAQSLEGSPRIMRALQVGASVLKRAGLSAAEAGTVQGTQTFARSGGDVGETVKDTALAAGTAGGLGVAGSALGGVLGKGGEVAGKVKELSDQVGNAATKEEVAKSIGSKIDTAEEALHTRYENGIQDLQGRLQNAEISPQENPLAEKAKEVLAEPNPEDHPTVARTKVAAGDHLDKKVRDLLQEYATGEAPESANKVAEDAQPSGLVGPDGQPIQSEAAEPEPTLNPAYKIDDLIKLRQTIRSMATGYDYGDINSRALRSLLPAVDDTIGKLAEQSGDATAVSDYKNLRSDYKNEINLYDEPVIKKLREGKVDDAAKDFVGVVRDGSALPTAGKVGKNLENLRGIIGDDGVKQFGKQVLGTIMQDSVENGRFNPARFVGTMKKVTEQTKVNLFNSEDADSGFQQLMKDSKSAATIQHLARVGVLVGAAKLGMAYPEGAVGAGLVSILGLTVTEGGGVAKGRELLDYIANHPKMWGTLKALGNAAENPTAQKVAGTAAKAAGNAVVQSTKPSQSQNQYQGVSQPDDNEHYQNTYQADSEPAAPGADKGKLKSAYQSTAGSLGGSSTGARIISVR